MSDVQHYCYQPHGHIIAGNLKIIEKAKLRELVSRGDSLIKVGTDVRAWALGISEVNFCPGIIRLWEVNSARTFSFW